MNQQGMLFSRATVDAPGGFDLRSKLCADRDFWVRADAAGRAFRFHPLEVGRLRYRLRNLPRYLTRLKRAGWKTSEEVLSGGA